MFTCFYLAAILPRLKNYSYILLVLPVIYFIAKRATVQEKAIFSFLVLGHFLTPYYNYFLLVFFFLYWVRDSFRLKKA